MDHNQSQPHEPGDHLMDPSDHPIAILPSTPRDYQDRPPVSLTSAILDSEGITRLMRSLFSLGGMTPKEASIQLGLTRNAVSAYTTGLRPNPTIRTFVRLVELCGGRVWIEWPKRRL